MRSGLIPPRDTQLEVWLPAGEGRKVRCTTGVVIADTREGSGRRLLIELPLNPDEKTPGA